MTTSAINQVSSKLKVLTDALLQEVEKYIDFLTFKYNQETAISNIPQWQKDIVLERLYNPQATMDAFDMIDDLENEKI